MSKHNENKLVPKLRFPEFINDEGWEETTLGKVSDITNGKSNAQDHIENGKYPLFDRSAVIKASNNFLFDCEAVIIPGEGMRFTPKYYKGKFDLHQRAYVLKDFTIDGIFAYYSMSHRSDLLALKAVKSTVLSLRLPILQNFLIQIPPSQNEQQKIAACLSSLDEVITAENQKLALLKDHKKGLLQNMLPQAGETVPKFRFKEFENSGEWEQKSFEELFEIGNGRDYKHLESGNIPVYGSGGYMLAVNEFLYDGESVCIGRKGTIDKPIFLTGKFWTVDTLFYTHSFKECLPKYIFYVFQNINWRNHNEAGGVPSLSKANIYKIEIHIPKPKEQEKIAETLSSVDDLIIAQNQKLEALQLHKKGLLQGLFPSVNDGDNGKI